MYGTRYTWTILFFIFGTAIAMENYMDYGNEPAEVDKGQPIDPLYRMLAQRSADEVEDLESSLLQPRAAERAPTLRLRFGRSYPKYPRSPKLRLRFGRSTYPANVWRWYYTHRMLVPSHEEN